MKRALLLVLMLAGCQHGNFAASEMQQNPHRTGKRVCAENDFTLSKSGEIKCRNWQAL